MRIGVMHPGAMGVSVAQTLLDSGHDVGWVAAGRSSQTRQRAQHLTELDGVDELAAWADGIVSVCPPDRAVAVAEAVHATAFNGFFVDANAIAPNTSRHIASIIGPGGFVDGGIIGPPAEHAGSTRLYLSGEHAGYVASWFSAGALSAVPLPMSEHAHAHVAASALKMVNALAEVSGVAEALNQEWQLSQPELLRRSELTAQGTSPKAWRFYGEMLEISETFTDYDLPGDFHAGAAEIYQRMAQLKELAPQSLDEVVASIISKHDSGAH